ncbi:LysR family transcriptional regulator [Veillonella sp. R32]|uniref:LysR family transcriptional regulator n=1 Tax=Veillonella sp. R32 TaxID=2021312 RepID=UPI0021077963|nr:LysR family transcriptional regulator [Veillonella sp. R32]KAF1683849.1 hypothetical protein VER_00685 [Veillonella sp. R32]
MKIDYLYYFKELVKDMNMTQTANRLFISQQTLSNYIQRVEKYYSIKLFNRTPKLELTEAGREFLNFADSILKQNTAIKNIFTDYNEDIRGTLRFGASHVRALRLLPSILPEFGL